MKDILSLFVKSHITTDAEFLRQRVRDFLPTQENPFGFNFKHTSHHAWMEIGQGKTIVFSPGLFGSYRNFGRIASALSATHRILVPFLPLYDLPIKECTIKSLGTYLESFCEDLALKDVTLAGNSMGGGASLHYALKNPENVTSIILFASSGLSFIPMRKGFMRLKDRDYIKEILSDIFYDANLLSEAEIDEVFSLIQNKEQLLRCLSFTRSTKHDLLHEKLRTLSRPTLIFWGENDNVTPKHYAHEFHALLPNSELAILPECGHVPCYEKAEECIPIIQRFIRQH